MRYAYEKFARGLDKSVLCLAEHLALTPGSRRRRGLAQAEKTGSRRTR
jgi:hypothetical protein